MSALLCFIFEKRMVLFLKLIFAMKVYPSTASRSPSCKGQGRPRIKYSRLWRFIS